MTDIGSLRQLALQSDPGDYTLADTLRTQGRDILRDTQASLSGLLQDTVERCAVSDRLLDLTDALAIVATKTKQYPESYRARAMAEVAPTLQGPRVEDLPNVRKTPLGKEFHREHQAEYLVQSPFPGIDPQAGVYSLIKDLTGLQGSYAEFRATGYEPLASDVYDETIVDQAGQQRDAGTTTTQTQTERPRIFFGGMKVTGRGTTVQSHDDTHQQTEHDVLSHDDKRLEAIRLVSDMLVRLGRMQVVPSTRMAINAWHGAGSPYYCNNRGDHKLPMEARAADAIPVRVAGHIDYQPAHIWLPIKAADPSAPPVPPDPAPVGSTFNPYDHNVSKSPL